MTDASQMNPTLEARLRNEAAGQGVDAATYIAAALEALLPDQRNEQPRLSANESELVHQINLGISPEIWQQYHDLLKKRRAEALEPEDQRALVELSNQIEQANARRIEYVAQLANLRGIPLTEMMTQLGIRPRSDA